METKMEKKMENKMETKMETKPEGKPGVRAELASERSSDLGPETKSGSKFGSWQPPVTRIPDRRMAENLIVKGHNLLRVEPDRDRVADEPYGSSAAENWVYVFAGTRARETADGIAEGKITLEQSARSEAARRFATGMIRAAILEHRHRENLAQTYREVAELLPESERTPSAHERN
jgi:hypothetical protein